MISDCDRRECRSLGCGFVTSDCDRRGSLGCGSGLGCVCVCVYVLLGVLLTGVIGLPLCLSSFFSPIWVL